MTKVWLPARICYAQEAVLKKLANSIIVEMKNSRTPVLPFLSSEKFYDPELKRKTLRLRILAIHFGNP